MYVTSGYVMIHSDMFVFPYVTCTVHVIHGISRHGISKSAASLMAYAKCLYALISLYALICLYALDSWHTWHIQKCYVSMCLYALICLYVPLCPHMSLCASMPSYVSMAYPKVLCLYALVSQMVHVDKSRVTCTVHVIQVHTY